MLKNKENNGMEEIDLVITPPLTVKLVNIMSSVHQGPFSLTFIRFTPSMDK